MAFLMEKQSIDLLVWLKANWEVVVGLVVAPIAIPMWRDHKNKKDALEMKKLEQEAKFVEKVDEQLDDHSARIAVLETALTGQIAAMNSLIERLGHLNDNITNIAMNFSKER
jgi:uncharacterized membrane-anchored protein YhcB (DUF1043 family)